MKHPNFFIIGAPKCGTSAVAKWLAEHSEVYMSPVKEPHYYNFDISSPFKTLDEYLALFENAGKQHKAVGEASVRYLYSRAASNIMRDNPDALFVVMLRNPVDMAPALHEQRWFTLIDNIKDFRKAWRLQEKRKMGMHIPAMCRDAELLQYGSWCKLGEQVFDLLQVVPRDNCHFIYLDDLKKSPQKEWTSLLKFLGVSDDNRNTFFVENAAKTQRFRFIVIIFQKLGILKRSVFGKRFRIGLTKWTKRILRKERRRPTLDLEMEAELERYFREDIDLLGEVTGRDLSNWFRLNNS